MSSRPCYADVTTDDGVRHVLWRSSLEESAQLQEEFAKVPNTYIADGHHRAASAYNVGKIRRQAQIDAGASVTGEEPFNFFMALHYPADNLKILDYNRILRSLNGLSSSDFIAKLSENFIVA